MTSLRLLYLTTSAISFAAALIWFVVSLRTGRNDFLLVSMGHLSIVALVLFPSFVETRTRFFDPFNFLLLYVLIGGVVSSYFIAFHRTSRVEYLMGDRGIEYFLSASMWYATALLLISLGYVLCSKRVRLECLITKDVKATEKGMQFAVLVGTVISVVGITEYIQRTGGLTFSINELSQKRSIEVVSNGEVVHAAGGYLRLLSETVTIALLMVLAYYLSRYKEMPLFVRLQVCTLALAALIVPFVSSSRSTVAFVVIGIVMTVSVYRKFRRLHILLALVVALSLFTTMSVLRTEAQGGSRFNTPLLVAPFFALAQSGNGLSLYGTTHVIHGVPDRMPYQLGKTYFTWVTAPIPRSIWPEKPDVALGKRVKEEILRQPVYRTGRPPGILGEGWINFGALGFLLSALIFGYALRLVSNTFAPLHGTNILAAPLYYSLSLNTAALADAAFSQGVVRILTDVVIVIAVFLLVRYSFPARRVQHKRTLKEHSKNSGQKAAFVKTSKATKVRLYQSGRRDR